jgi:predicted dehydrogenase
MTKRSLVVGMGIGQLYKTILEKLGHEVITVDSEISKGAMLPTVESAMLAHAPFDTVHICTPNFTHEVIARTVAPVSKIIFIEKPGVIDSKCWQCLVEDFPNTRFMMVKNNMWRSNINELIELASKAKTVKIRWIRRNCIPSPGSWFTTKDLAFGGVSRDLMPHLLSLYVAMNPDWKNEKLSGQTAMQCWELKDIENTDYGTVNPNGTYNVDDMCVVNFSNKWRCAANWRSTNEEDSSIAFVMQDNTIERFELGWCPEEAYHNMIVDAIANMDNSNFWLQQYAIDYWIHERIEKL